MTHKLARQCIIPIKDCSISLNHINFKLNSICHVGKKKQKKKTLKCAIRTDLFCDILNRMWLNKLNLIL